MKHYLIFIFLAIFNLSCDHLYNSIWDDYFSFVGGHHKKNLSDDLKSIGVCEEQDSGETCLWTLFAKYDILSSPTRTDIQIKNSSSYSRITFTFKDQVVVLNASEISKIITVPFDPVGLYKIETTAGVVFENSSFNFRGSLKDGTIITTDGTLINDLDLAGCNLINVETGEVETVSGQCLTPTNP